MTPFALPAPAATAASFGARPYLSGPVDNRPGSRWQRTPDDPSRFPAVQGSDAGPGVGLITAPAGFGPNESSLAAALSVMPDLAHAGWANGGRAEPQDTWYRVRMMFPRDRYLPTRGEWNWVVEWHNDDRTAAFPGAYSIALGVYTDYTGADGSPGVNPRLAFRLMGGDALSPQVRTIELPPGSLSYDHWYDLSFHMVWSADPTAGLAEWWCDGMKMASVRFPTLYALPDGTHSYNGFGLYNYRLRSDWTSEVDFGDVAIGPDAASVGAPVAP
jgi:hypothetical protein